jgi:hypothetical protein
LSVSVTDLRTGTARSREAIFTPAIYLCAYEQGRQSKSALVRRPLISIRAGPIPARQIGLTGADLNSIYVVNNAGAFLGSPDSPGEASIVRLSTDTFGVILRLRSTPEPSSFALAASVALAFLLLRLRARARARIGPALPRKGTLELWPSKSTELHQIALLLHAAS